LCTPGSWRQQTNKRQQTDGHRPPHDAAVAAAAALRACRTAHPTTAGLHRPKTALQEALPDAHKQTGFWCTHCHCSPAVSGSGPTAAYQLSCHANATLEGRPCIACPSTPLPCACTSGDAHGHSFAHMQGHSNCAHCVHARLDTTHTHHRAGQGQTCAPQADCCSWQGANAGAADSSALHATASRTCSTT
jgi:hypothetical protein